MGFTPVPTEEAFLILEPYLPLGTRLTSAYRSPEDQISVIHHLVQKHNAEKRNKKDTIPLPEAMRVDEPQTWLPPLKALRARGYKVNAPAAGHGIPLSPHTTYNIVFDLSGADLRQIENGCRRAQQRGVIGFRQILREPANHAVHVDVTWISARALEELYTRMGFAIV